jgi:hypothetical protein
VSNVVRRIVVGLVAVGALAGFVYAFTLGGNESADPRRTNSAVERFIPPDGSPAVVRQAEVGVDLATGWTGVLAVDGVEIPEDELRRNEPENQVFFMPGPGRVVDELAPGPHTVTALIWRLENETRADAQPVSWSFRAA